MFLKKTTGIFFIVFLSFNLFDFSFAFPVDKLDSFIKNSKLNETSTISVSIKNIKDAKIVYRYNDKKFLNPASSLKIFTTYPTLEILGYDYQFTTSFYKDFENNLYIKLGADPYLTFEQLKEAFKKVENSDFNAVYFDDYIIDKQEFLKGWMQEDEIDSNTPKVSAYNLDKNVIKFYTKDISASPVEFYSKINYPVTVTSEVLYDAVKNKLETNRYNWDNPYVVNIKGYVNKPTYVVVPLSNMKRYFTYCVNILLKENNINVKNGVFASKTLPNDVVLLTQIKNPIEPAINDILQKSNNFTSETLFKLASSKKYDTTGSDALSVKIFQEFYSKLMKSKNKVIVHDGCGVSRNNMMYTDWMTDALLVLYKEKNFDKFKEHMAHPGTGTLKYRLSELQNGAYLKTGTLAHVSSITGYITSQDGNIYAAAIITQGFNQNSKEVKAFEDKIIRLIYSK